MKNSINGILLKYYDILLLEYVEYIKISLSLHNYTYYNIIYQYDDSLDEVCNIFDCKKSSLRRWIMKYKAYRHIERLNRPSISYKITKQHLQYAISLLNKNEQITMKELHSKVQKKYKTL
jgi:transposase